MYNFLHWFQVLQITENHLCCITLLWRWTPRFLVFDHGFSYLFSSKPLHSEHFVREQMSCPTQLCPFQSNSFSRGKPFTNRQRGLIRDRFTIRGERIRESTAGKRTTDMQSQQQEQEASDEAQFIHSISVYNDWQSSKVSVCPKLVYHRPRILSGYCQGDAHMLEPELLQIFQSSDPYFLNVLTTFKTQ